MATLEYVESWTDRFARIFQPANRLAALKDMEALGPMLRLILEAPHMMGPVSAYRVARSNFLAYGGQALRAEYEAALRLLAKELVKVSPESRTAALVEMRAMHRFVGDAETLAGLVKGVAVLAPSKLTAVEETTLNLLTERITGYDGPYADDLMGFWEHFTSVVTPGNEAAWKEILQVAHQAGKKGLSQRLFENTRAADEWLSGHLSSLQGKLFETYVSLSTIFSEFADDAMRTASKVAAKLGPEWQAIRIDGELELAVLSSNRIAKARIDGKGLAGVRWSRFVDHSVGAAKLPEAADGLLGELDLTAVFQDKVEAGATKLIGQAEKDLASMFKGATNKSVIARFRTRDASGALSDYRYVRLRPPGTSQPLQVYAIGTSNTLIPDSAMLAEMGITLKRVQVTRSRDEFNDLAKDLFWAAMTALGMARR